MLDVNALKAEWVRQGLRQKDVADLLGIAPKTLSLKLKKGVLGSDEIELLTEKLNINNPMDIFFKKEVTYKATLNATDAA